MSNSVRFLLCAIRLLETLVFVLKTIRLFTLSSSLSLNVDKFLENLVDRRVEAWEGSVISPAFGR